MRLFTRMFVGLFAMLCFALPGVLRAETQNVSVNTGYGNILKQGIIFANICPDPAPENGQNDNCRCRAQGICSLAEVTQVAVNITIFILGISGTVALLMFIYGGWNWVFAQGRSDYISSGKDAMKNASIGLAIIFGAYAIINMLFAILGGKSPAGTIEDTIKQIDAKKGIENYEINAGEVIDTR